MSDETTEPVRVVCPHSYTAACRECLPLTSAARLKAENARLRERVAVLERMAEYAQHDLGCYALESRLGEAAACKCGFYEDRVAYRALSQADDDGGRA